MWHIEERIIVKQWDKLILSMCKDLFLVYSIKKETWGYNLMIVIPPGYTLEKLESFKDAIEDNFICICMIDKKRFDHLTNVKLITKDFKDDVFKPIELDAHTLYLGNDYAGRPITVDMNRFPHLLIAGSTGGGKSRLAFCILTNLLYNKASVDIYLTQIRKRDLRKFKDSAKGYATDEFEAAKMFTEIQNIIAWRVKLLDKADCDNIEEYKGVLPYIMIFGDEFSFFMEDKTDPDDLKEVKQTCLSKIKDIIKTGRSVGVFLIIGLQRTTHDELLPIVKAMMRTKVSFIQTSKLNSQNAIEGDEAFMLPEREFIILTNKKQHAKTPYIDKELVKTYISPAIIEKPLREQYNATFVPNTEPIRKVKVIEDINYGKMARGRKKGVLKDVNSKG